MIQNSFRMCNIFLPLLKKLIWKALCPKWLSAADFCGHLLYLLHWDWFWLYHRLLIQFFKWRCPARYSQVLVRTSIYRLVSIFHIFLLLIFYFFSNEMLIRVFYELSVPLRYELIILRRLYHSRCVSTATVYIHEGLAS